MAVIEPRRKSPNSKNSVKMAERCCSRLARDSGKGYLLILTYHYVRICDTKKETSPIPPFMSRTHLTTARAGHAILDLRLIDLCFATAVVTDASSSSGNHSAAISTSRPA